MKTAKSNRMRNLLIGLLAMTFLSAMVPKTVLESILLSDFLKDLKSKLAYFESERPEDRVYLQLDKTLYEPGETIWFSAFVQNGADLKKSQKSEILYVELIDPKGNTSKTLSLIAKGGKTNGEFELGEHQLGGLYKVKAYTNWQKNSKTYFEKEVQVQNIVLPKLLMRLDFQRKAYGSGEEAIAKLSLNTLTNKPLASHKFNYVASIDGEKILEKAFQTNLNGDAFVKVQLPKELESNDGLLNVMIEFEGSTESISRSIPITLGNIRLDFFPEGGDLVDGLTTKVAFKALNEFSKPADISGVVKNSSGVEVVTFSSFHQGMGAFNFTPKTDEKYTVEITNPEGVNKIYSLPTRLKRGWVMNVDQSENVLKVTVNSTETEKMYLVGQVRGKDYILEDIVVNKGKNEFELSTDDFPIGVAQITLFDSRQIPRAERLTFVNKTRQLNIEVKTNKEQYLPREKVDVSIAVTDERGIPVPANLSMAVVDEKTLTFADDKSGNILTELLLSQDLKGKIEEPKFYFDPKEAKADEALDYLLMTSGWRRFTWKSVLDGELPTITYQGEKTAISGQVLYNNEGVGNATITLQDGSNRVYKTDEKGFFNIEDIELNNTFNAFVKSDDLEASLYIYKYGSDYKAYLYKPYRYDYYADDWGGAEEGAVEMRAGNGAVKKVQKFKANEARVPMMAVEKKEEIVLNNVQIIEEDKIVEVDVDEEEIEAGFADGKAFMWDMEEELEWIAEDRRIAPAALYHRAKEFPAPDYSAQQEVEVRTDFRSTIHWDGNIEAGNNGLASVSFYNSDEVTAYRITIEGVGVGLVGRKEHTYFTQLPFSMSTKVPHQVLFEDEVMIPLTLKNNTKKAITGELTVKAPKGFKATGKVNTTQTIAANSASTIYLSYTVLNELGEDSFEISFENGCYSDAFEQEVKIGAKGYPVSIALSGQDLDKTYNISINDPVNGSIVATLTAYPNVMNDLMSGIESIIREPSGCFEQTSMSNYPNIMALNYMRATDFDDPELMVSIDEKLGRGYKKLTSFETKEKGYEWFGSSPGHEALTAYGLMQFNDMKAVYRDLSQEMIDRTAQWIMERRDGKGGFKKNPRALDQFGRASDVVTNAYIVYALSEAGYRDIQPEIEAAYTAANNSKDGYLLGLMANTLYNFKDKRAEGIMKQLMTLQQAEGYFTSDHSITRSGGKSLQVETTSIAVLAMLKAENADNGAMTKAVKFIVESRSNYGGFGSTQGTVLALKALSEFAVASKKTDEAGTLECWIDGKKVASKDYEAGHRGDIIFEGLESYLGEGKHKITVKYKGTKVALPYTVAINFSTTLPNSAEECVIDLSTKINAKSCKVGETVRLATKVTNKTDKGQPMTMAAVGIPSGLSAQPWQLKELMEKGKIDFYEVTDNYVIFYFRDMAPSEKHEINLDLKAEVPGKFEAPASCGYLYYTNEYKNWTSTGKITIEK